MPRFAAAPVLVALLIAACGEAAGPDDLTVDLDISPGTVAPGDSLRAQLTIANPTSGTVRLTTGPCGALGVHRAFRDGEASELDGMVVDPARILCSSYVPWIDIAPGSSLTREWPLRASAGGAPAPPGDYRFRFEPVAEELEAAEDTFVVEGA